jgi:transposase
MEATPRWLGIDVAKERLDCCSLPDGTSWQVANDAAGWAQLVAQLASHPPAGIVLEATGRYEVGLVLALEAAGWPAAVMNPLTMRRYAQSLGRRAKTDRLDARVLARYAEQVRPAPRPVPAEIARQLRDLLARRQQLTEMLVMEKNRLGQATPLIRPSLTASIAALDQQIALIDDLLATIVASDPEWQHRVDQLDSVPGIGPLSAVRLAVWLPELGRLTARELASLAGVAPFARESGQQRGSRQIAGGRALARTTLYHVMTSTKRWEPTFAAHDRQLKARGKPPKVAQVACMRRLLGILNAMIRDDLMWSDTLISQGAFLPPGA